MDTFQILVNNRSALKLLDKPVSSNRSKHTVGPQCGLNGARTPVGSPGNPAVGCSHMDRPWPGAQAVVWV